MANKALIIDVDERFKSSGNLKCWEKINDADVAAFTRDIKTPDLAEGANTSAVITGMPSVFARANLFRLALDYAGDSMSGSSSLMNFYSSLKDEWFGLIACLALDTTVEIKRIYLNYSDEQSFLNTENIYEARGAFGNMLFDRRPLWSEIDAAGKVGAPFIDVIKYNQQVIGGTSPDSLLFTAPKYVVKDSRFSKNGKFCNPLKDGQITDDDLLPLYAYVEKLLKNIDTFETYFQRCQEQNIKVPSYIRIKSILKDWLNEIKRPIADRISQASANPVSGFHAPFALIFNYSDVLYSNNGTFSSTQKEGFSEFRPEELLLPKESEIAHIVLPVSSDRIPVYLLEADVRDAGEARKAYFALPLSNKGYAAFGRNIGALIDRDQTIVSSLISADYYENNKIEQLKVTLSITVDNGVQKTVQRNYTIKKKPIENIDVLIWPNFISTQWRRYFMFSELPCDADLVSDFHAAPFVGSNLSKQEFTPIVDENQCPIYLDAPDNVLKDHHIVSKQLIRASAKNADLAYKYDVYESESPYAGLRLTSGDKESGLLIIRYMTKEHAGFPTNYITETENNFSAGEVSLGVDFGSTNTSIAYIAPGTANQVQALTFKNRRISLFGLDQLPNRRIHPRDILFFYAPQQGMEVKSNAIKSMLAIHNSRRLQRTSAMGSIDPDILQSSAISGGVPCLLRNLPIVGVKNDHINLEFKNGESIDIISNMKWQASETDRFYVSAYLRCLLLYVYAELFELRSKPTRLNWSYPSSMDPNKVRNKYGRTWQDMNREGFIPIMEPGTNGTHGNTIDIFITEYQGQGGPVLGNGAAFGAASAAPAAGGSPFGGATASPFGGASASPFGGASFGTPATAAPMANGMPSFGAPAASAPGAGIMSLEDRIKAEAERINEVKEDFTIDEILGKANVCEKLEFVPKDVTRPMTEAQAVGNYTANKYNTGSNLVLCFDIGGSTSDISAIYDYMGKRTMLKQSSIRFAAQRIASATSIFSTKFRDVLKHTTQKFGLTLIGFNDNGTDRYSKETAPYYFEQIVDSLRPEQLKDFYSYIAADCPELFAVDLYVTGLIMYYAGQLASKLYTVLAQKLSNDPRFGHLKFQPVFEGKGGRIFDWLFAIDSVKASQYYQMMFARGLGYPIEQFQAVANALLDFSHMNALRSEVKMEVSGGLAMDGNLQVPPSDSSLEIFGEANFVGYSRTSNKQYSFKADDDLTYERMALIGDEIYQDPEESPNFMAFADLYYQCMPWLMGVTLNADQFRDGVTQMKPTMYISRECADFIEAKRTSANGQMRFEFLSPIIILEGIKFYERHLLKCLQ